MNNHELLLLREKLVSSLEELKTSVMSAYDQFLIKYGAGHPYICRLECYFPIISKQEELILVLDDMIKNEDINGVSHISAKIRGLAEMVKEDARSLLYSINSGDATSIQDVDIH